MAKKKEETPGGDDERRLKIKNGMAIGSLLRRLARIDIDALARRRETLRQEITTLEQIEGLARIKQGKPAASPITSTVSEATNFEPPTGSAKSPADDDGLFDRIAAFLKKKHRATTFAIAQSLNAVRSDVERVLADDTRFDLENGMWKFIED